MYSNCPLIQQLFISRSHLPNPLRFDLTPQQIAGLSQEVIALTTRLGDMVAATPHEKASMDTVLEAEKLEHWPRVIASLIGFMKDSHPDKAVRDAASEADTLMENHFTAQGVREDVYSVYKAVKQNTQAKRTATEDRMLELIMRSYRRSGLDLSKEKKDELVALKKEAKELEQKMDQLSLQ
jgi:Zn-dependent oligopeptidase